MNIDMLDTSTGTAEPPHHMLGRSTAISIFYLPLLSTSWIWVAWSVPTFGCLLAAVRNKGSACRTWRQLRGRWWPCLAKCQWANMVGEWLNQKWQKTDKNDRKP